jgi:hypothetical protein
MVEHFEELESDHEMTIQSATAVQTLTVRA